MGNYLPAIRKAKDMLFSNKFGGCALQLVFLTDGAPSDNAPMGIGTTDYHKYAIAKEVASLASRFGSRLTVGGFAVGSGEYSVLQNMMETAKEYNCKTFFMKASLRVQDLSGAFTSMSSLISSTKNTMTAAHSKKQRTVRDFEREPKSIIDVYIENEPEWKVYMNSADNPYAVDRAVFNKATYQWEFPRQRFNSYGAKGIAIRDQIFGEGNERAVRRVREVDTNGNFVGPPLVGKETLYREDLDRSDSIQFHKTFCKIQQLAQRLAMSFNRKLLALPGVDRNTIPTIQFLQCYVMIYNDEACGRKGLLVEKMLDHRKYKKWNTNDGYVEGMPSKNFGVASKSTQGSFTPFQDSEDDEGEETDDSFTVKDVPQAYSHFTYMCTGRKLLVCDLQGVLNTNSGRPVFEMTDPAIHYKERTNRQDFGRTDLGLEGIFAFLRTHKCSGLCQMLMRQWIKEPMEEDIIRYDAPIQERKVKFAA